MTLQFLLTAWLLSPSQPLVQAPVLPEMRGFRLGASIEAVGGRSLPCQNIDGRRACDTRDSVRLFFDNGRLSDIVVQFGIRPIGAKDRWFALTDSLEHLFGKPDSVAMRSDGLTAYWGSMSKAAPWLRTFSVIELRSGTHVASTAWLSLFGCIEPTQGSLCADLLR